MGSPAKFEVINEKTLKFGKNKFLEISRKKAVTPEGENEFISISKGFFTPDGQKRFKNALGFEFNQELLKQVSEALMSI